MAAGGARERVPDRGGQPQGDRRQGPRPCGARQLARPAARHVRRRGSRQALASTRHPAADVLMRRSAPASSHARSRRTGRCPQRSSRHQHGKCDHGRTPRARRSSSRHYKYTPASAHQRRPEQVQKAAPARPRSGSLARACDPPRGRQVGRALGEVQEDDVARGRLSRPNPSSQHGHAPVASRSRPARLSEEVDLHTLIGKLELAQQMLSLGAEGGVASACAVRRTNRSPLWPPSAVTPTAGLSSVEVAPGVDWTSIARRCRSGQRCRAQPRRHGPRRALERAARTPASACSDGRAPWPRVTLGTRGSPVGVLAIESCQRAGQQTQRAC